MPALPVDSTLWDSSSKLLSRLKSLYVTEVEAEAPPLLSERFALSCVILYTIIYIAPFYLSPTLRTSSLQSRDAPSVIRARVRAVGLSCLASTAITVYILAIHGHATPRDVLRLLGFWPIDPLDILKTLLLVGVLFLGPTYESLIVDGEWRDVNFAFIKASVYDSWTGYRNLIIAPVSEELVFRSLAISLYLLTKTSPSRIVFTTPLIFGLAHIHHLKEFISSRTPEGRRFPPTPVLIQGLVMSIFQFGYTSLFGFFAAFVFLRTGNFFAATLAHSFCNYMGLPRFWGRLGQEDVYLSNLTPDVAQGKRDDGSEEQVKVGNGMMQKEDDDEDEPAPVLQPKRLGIEWTVGYYALIVVGSLGFYKLLWPLTESSNALAVFR